MRLRKEVPDYKHEYRYSATKAITTSKVRRTSTAL
jgi:hypothetical protein